MKATVALFALTAAAHAEMIASGPFRAELNRDFPGLLSYGVGDATMIVPPATRRAVVLNGEERIPEVSLSVTGPTAAEYGLHFRELGLFMKVAFTASHEALDIRVTDVRETGAFALRTVEIPELALLAGTADDAVALGNFPAASYASEDPADHDIFGTVAEVVFKDNEDEKKKNKNRDAAGNRGASYAFLTNGKLAAGLWSNVLDENLRMIVRFEGEGGSRTFTARPGKWTYREIPGETIPMAAKLVVATDRNGDGAITWQDAAIAYRGNTPRPYGAETTKDFPIAHIAMNFGSQATNPFLRVLDNAKKVWLYTDGLGQRIQFKGFAGEGHDSSHPDYAGNVGRRMGGREDLNFVMRRGRDFKVLSGVHINAHEYHAEAKWFSPDIVSMNAIGWSWLDESYLTDYRHDSAYGTLYQRLEAMRDDLPWLDFVYLDVYYGRGWPGWRMHTKTNALGIIQFTEFPGVMERAVVWNHVANDWTQAIGGKGDRSEIARFIYYSQKDTFKHEPLLRGTNCDGFMGWHAERSMLQTIKSAITVNLPTKYLQHFELARQEMNAAWFAGGPRVEADGVVSRMFGRDGQLINSCRYDKPKTRPVDNFSFIPWPPLAEEKIYVWSDKGGEVAGELPKSWTGTASAQLYRLTDLGRVFERDIAVSGGKVTLTGILPDTPYVLYRSTPPALPDMHWGEGGLVKDPGFDSHAFGAWRSDGKVRFENHPQYGQTELVMPGPGKAAVSQTIEGLVPGKTYAASAWLCIDGERQAGILVTNAPARPLFRDRQGWRVTASVPQYAGDRPSRMFDGDPVTLWHSAEAKDEATKQPHFITVDFNGDLAFTGFVQTCRDNKGNGAIKSFIAETSKDGKSFTQVAAGDFAYGDGVTATVDFGKTVKARYFRLTATATLTGAPFTSIAELDFTGLEDAPPQAVGGLFAANDVTTTRFPNWTDQSSKYERNWHRVKVLFTAPQDGRATVVLRAAAGDATVAFDDVRVVKCGVSAAPPTSDKVVLFEDFENVDEGWGPFMYGWKGPMNTHLSEANPPYTRDTIGGEFSLKSRQEDSPNLLYRTVPATLKLRPNTTYQVSFDYLCDKPDCFAFFAGPDATAEITPADAHILRDGSWTTQRFTGTFTTDARPDWFIGITKLKRENKGTVVIDNVLVTE
ncbi:MAG: endo-alpha-N-acetylgalactosaminidase family protein [Akkermansiaceae bacterium]|nr:endo-alpha-N-acetylgalactosaminidase family protein [Akkermansiaceae bacterium]